MGVPGHGAVLATVLAALVLAACSGGGDGTTDDPGSAAVTEDAADAPGGGTGAALLGVIDPGVDVADEPADPAAAAFRIGEDGEGLVVGDLVRTDDAGFAEVAWFDGALARVDAGTLYALVELDTTPGEAVVVTDLEVGRIWNRLRADEVDRYEVVTDVGTAAVRGTAFWVQCVVDGACTFAVLEGAVEVTTADGTTVAFAAGQQVTVGADGVAGRTQATDFGDAWVVRNAALDEDAGFAPLEQPEPSLACPLVDVPEGWVLEPPDDPQAPEAQFCRYVNPDAAVPGWATVQWSGQDSEWVRGFAERGRPFFEEARDRIASSECSGAMREAFTAFDEPVGVGHLNGYAYLVMRGPLPASFDDCLNEGRMHMFSVLVDGQFFQVEEAEGLSHCQDPQADETPDRWTAYVDCRFAEYDARIAEYREIAATLLGG